MRRKIHESLYGESQDNFHATRDGEELEITITYPPYEGEQNPKEQVRYVVFDQESVRVSDGIRISYDYSRDGYVIEQPSVLAWEIDDTVCDPCWKETAFVQAWALSDPEIEG